MVYRKINKIKYFTKIDKKNLKIKKPKSKIEILPEKKEERFTKLMLGLMFLIVIVVLSIALLAPERLRNFNFLGLSYHFNRYSKIRLDFGYNIIGFNDVVDRDAFKNAKIIYSWDKNTRSWKAYEGPMYGNQCYLIFNKKEEVLSIKTKLVNPEKLTLKLQKGWNCIIWPSNNYVLDSYDCIDAIYGYDSSIQNWELIVRSDKLKEFKGYFVYANRDCVIRFKEVGLNHIEVVPSKVITEPLPHLP